MERKWIPEVWQFKESDEPYRGCDLNVRAEELDEVIAHFITNLCGQGHYWLRRYCIDHFKMIREGSSYDLANLDNLVIKLTGVKTAMSKEVISQTIESFMANAFAQTSGVMANYVKIPVCYNSPKFYAVGDGDKIFKQIVPKMETSTGMWGAANMNVFVSERNQLLKENLVDIFNIIGDSENIITFGDKTIYDINENVGLYYDGSGWTMFTLQVTEKGMTTRSSGEKEHLQIDCEYMYLGSDTLPDNVNEQTDTETYQVEQKTEWTTKRVRKSRQVRRPPQRRSTYYSSSGDYDDYYGDYTYRSGTYYSSSGGYDDYYTDYYYTNERVKSTKNYLSHFGTLPDFVQPLAEMIAKTYLRV